MFNQLKSFFKDSKYLFLAISHFILAVLFIAVLIVLLKQKYIKLEIMLLLSAYEIFVFGLVCNLIIELSIIPIAQCITNMTITKFNLDQITKIFNTEGYPTKLQIAITKSQVENQLHMKIYKWQLPKIIKYIKRRKGLICLKNETFFIEWAESRP